MTGTIQNLIDARISDVIAIKLVLQRSYSIEHTLIEEADNVFRELPDI